MNDDLRRREEAPAATTEPDRSPEHRAAPKRSRPRLRTVVARACLRLGLSPNSVTVIGTIGMLVAAVGFAARGELLVATIIAVVSSFADLVDGEMARIGNKASRFGALLDSVLDRVADGAIFASLAYWLFTEGEQRAAAAALIALIAGNLVPYTRARAEGLGLVGETGIAPRFVRLEIIGVGGLFGAFGWLYGLEAALWLIALLATVTSWQRLTFARRQILEADANTEGAGPTR